MQIESKQLDGGQVQLTVTVPAKTVQKAENKAFEQLRAGLKLKGFRKGKVPADLAREQLSDPEIRAHMLETQLPRWYVEAVQDQKLKVIADPKLELTKADAGEDLVFTATVSVYPEVDVPDYKAIKVPAPDPQVSDEDKANALNNLKLEHVTYEEKSKAAGKEDVAKMNVKATMGDEELKAYSRKGYELVLGDGYFVPGFDENLYKMKAGDTKTFEIKMPDDYPLERFQGQTIVFEVEMLAVKERILPEVDDAFAQKLGLKDAAQLHEAVEANLKQMAMREATENFQKQVMDELLEASKFEAPEALVHEEVHKMEHEFEWRLSRQGFTLEQYLETRSQTREDLEKEWHPQAQKVAKLGLLLDHIAEAEKVVASEEEIAREMQAWLMQYRDKDGKLSKAGKRIKQSLTSANGQAYLSQMLRREKTRRHLYDLALPNEDKADDETKAKPKSTASKAKKPTKKSASKDKASNA